MRDRPCIVGRTPVEMVWEVRGVRDPIETLKNALNKKGSRALEDLACELLGRLAGVVFSRARSGDQRGGDGGVHEGGRHLVFEAKQLSNSGFAARTGRRTTAKNIEPPTHATALTAWAQRTSHISQSTAAISPIMETFA